jgi:GTP-binding protein
LLIHVVDVSGREGRDPLDDLNAINQELKQYSPDLANRPQIIAANKADILQEPENLERLRRHATDLGFPIFPISAATHQGLEPLLNHIWSALSSLPPIEVYQPDYIPPAPVLDDAQSTSIQHSDDGSWLLYGPWLERLLANVNSNDYESRLFLDKSLRQAGIFQKLLDLGVQDGDTVSLCGYQFIYQP